MIINPLAGLSAPILLSAALGGLIGETHLSALVKAGIARFTRLMARVRVAIVFPSALALSLMVPAAQAQPASLSLSNRAYAAIPTSPDFALQQFTISVWLKPTGPGENGGGTLVSKSGRPDAGSLLCSWWLGWASPSGKIVGLVVHEYGVSGQSVTSNASVALGQEAHAALTFDGATLRLYVNGVLDQEQAYGFSGVYYSTEDVLIGAFNPNAGYTFNRFQGTLDDVTIWDRALSASEIAALASCEPVGSGNGLVAHLPFTNLQLTDTSGHGHSAAAVGVIAYGSQAAALGSPPIVSASPSPQSVCPEGSASFTVTAADAGSLTYQWQVSNAAGTWVDVSDGPLVGPDGVTVVAEVSASTTKTVKVKIHREWSGDATFGKWRCRVSSPCASTNSDPATLTKLPNINSDGVINTLDLGILLAHFGTSVPRYTLGDINGDGVVNTIDLGKLLASFGFTCP